MSTTVTVRPNFTAGSITGGGGTICSGGDPGAMTANPSGGSGTYAYRWSSKAAGGACDGTGWTLISGATSQSYDPPAGLLTGTMYRCEVDATGSPDCGGWTWSSNCVTVNVYNEGTIGTWTGYANTNWDNAQNWARCTGPTEATNVVIPNVTNDPVVNVTTAKCADLTIQSGGVLNGGAGGVLSVYGNWTNNGTFTHNTGTVIFRGGNSNISTGGTGSTKAFNNVECNATGTKLLSTHNIDINGSFTLTAGSWDVGNYDMYVAVDWTRIGTFLPRSKTVFFDGSGESKIIGETAFTNVTIDKTGSGIVRLQNNISISGELNTSAIGATGGTSGGIEPGSYEIDVEP